MEMADATVETREDDAPASTGSFPQEYQDALDQIGKEPSDETVADDDADDAGKTAAATGPAEHEQDTSAGDDVDSVGDGDGEAASETDASASEEATSEGLSWQEEQSLAKDLKINSRGMKRTEVQAAILAETHRRTNEDSRMRDLRERVTARHGVDADDVAEITDFDELQRFGRALDRQQLAWQQAEADRASEATDGRQTQPARTEPAQGAAAEVTKPVEPDWEAMAETVDEGPLAFMKSMHERNTTLQTQLDQVVEHVLTRDERDAASTQEATVAKFDGLVDALDHEDLFGKGGRDSLSKEFQEKRTKLWNAAVGLAGNGGLTKDVVEDAMWATHRDELQEKRSRKGQAKLQAQSKRRIGGVSRANGKASFKGDIEDDPELAALYNRLDAQGA